MTSPLFTAGQSRWALQILVVVLSATAIASSAPSSAGGVSMYSGDPGDIRGLAVCLGICGVVGVTVMRLLSLLLSKPWRIYLDRLEFVIVAMLWICWTSATMAFCAFTINRGVCSLEVSEVYLPTCSLLTFDLTLLHLLSVSTLALLLVILSIALSPSYYLSLSPAVQDKGDPEAVGAFVMWDLALASPPPSPPPSPRLRSVGTYGSTESTIDNPYAPPTQRDKFAEGRVWNYAPLSVSSATAMIAAVWVITETRYVVTSAMIIVVGALSLLFSAGFLVLHYRQRESKVAGLRYDRALEVGCAGALFLLWPLAAISYTLFPPTPNRPCANPASSLKSPDDIPSEHGRSLCLLSLYTISVAWLASWFILRRVLGLIVPMPDVKGMPVQTGEGQSLLSRVEPERPRVKYGRIVAGEAFELGGEDD